MVALVFEQLVMSKEAKTCCYSCSPIAFIKNDVKE